MLSRTRAPFVPLFTAGLLLLGACSDEGDGADPDDMSEPVLVPDASRPDAAVTQPDATVADTDQEDARAPDATQPDASDPDATQPDASAPDATQPDASVDHDEPPVRLLIADSKSPKLHVVDVEQGAVIASFDTAAPARVYTGTSGLYGYATQSSADVVHVVHSGITVEPHDDHFHYLKGQPKLLERTFPGDNPIHFVAHDPWVALFFDDEGIARLVEESSLAGAPRVLSINSGAPHHGVAVPFHDHVLVTRPELLAGQTRATPTGIAVYDDKGVASGQVFEGCISVHGEASLDHTVAFGCKDGVLAVSHGASGFTSKLLANPTGTAAGTRVGTVVAHEQWPFFIGNFGAEAIARIDVQAGTITPKAVSGPYAQFIFAGSGEHLLVLTKDGVLRLLAPSTLNESASVPVLDPVGSDAAYAPQIAVAGHWAYVTDPSHARVHVIDLEQPGISKTIEVPGVPAKITALVP